MIVHDLEGAIPFQLARTGARMGNAFSKELKPFGLSLNEWRVCASLKIQPAQTLSELAPQAGAKISALSRMVDRLEAQNLVVRMACEEDGRSVRLKLTRAGMALTDRIIPHAKRYEEVALQGFTEAEVATLREMLKRIYNNTEALE